MALTQQQRTIKQYQDQRYSNGLSGRRFDVVKQGNQIKIYKLSPENSKKKYRKYMKTIKFSSEGVKTSQSVAASQRGGVTAAQLRKQGITSFGGVQKRPTSRYVVLDRQGKQYSAVSQSSAKNLAKQVSGAVIDRRSSQAIINKTLTMFRRNITQTQKQLSKSTQRQRQKQAELLNQKANQLFNQFGKNDPRFLRIVKEINALGYKPEVINVKKAELTLRKAQEQNLLKLSKLKPDAFDTLTLQSPRIPQFKINNKILPLQYAYTKPKAKEIIKNLVKEKKFKEAFKVLNDTVNLKISDLDKKTQDKLIQKKSKLTLSKLGKKDTEALKLTAVVAFGELARGGAGAIRGFKGAFDAITNPVAYAKNLWKAAKTPIKTLKEEGKRLRLDPVGVTAEYIAFGKTFGAVGKGIKRSPVGQYITKEAFILSQSKQIRPYVRKVLNAANVQRKLNPYKIKSLKKADFFVIKTMTKTEAAALYKTLSKTDSVVFGSFVSYIRSRKRTAKPKDIDLATRNIKVFSEKFIKELPKNLRKNYKLKGEKVIRVSDGSALFDLKPLNRLLPGKNYLTGRGRLPITGKVTTVGFESGLPKLKKKLGTSRYTLPTQKITKISGIKLTGFGEQTVRKALGTLQVLIEKNAKRAKDPASLVKALEVQLEALIKKQPKNKIGNLNLNRKIKVLQDSLKVLKSKEFANLLNYKVKGLTKEYPLVAKINTNKLKNIKINKVLEKKIIKKQGQLKIDIKLKPEAKLKIQKVTRPIRIARNELTATNKRIINKIDTKLGNLNIKYEFTKYRVNQKIKPITSKASADINKLILKLRKEIRISNNKFTKPIKQILNRINTIFNKYNVAIKFKKYELGQLIELNKFQVKSKVRKVTRPIRIARNELNKELLKLNNLIQENKFKINNNIKNQLKKINKFSPIEIKIKYVKGSKTEILRQKITLSNGKIIYKQIKPRTKIKPIQKTFKNTLSKVEKTKKTIQNQKEWVLPSKLPAKLTSSQLSSKLPASKLSKLPASKLSKLPVSALSKLPISTLSKLPASKLSKLPVSALSKLPISTLSKLPLSKLPKSILSKLPASKLSKLPVSALSKLPISRIPIFPISKIPPTNKPPKRFRRKLKTKKEKEDYFRWLKKQPPIYRPSLAAILYNITATKPPKSITGLEIRPILIKKTKKKR
jgi:hypothetical protein